LPTVRTNNQVAAVLEVFARAVPVGIEVAAAAGDDRALAVALS
jgi:hypothetical protein